MSIKAPDPEHSDDCPMFVATGNEIRKLVAPATVGDTVKRPLTVTTSPTRMYWHGEADALVTLVTPVSVGV